MKSSTSFFFSIKEIQKQQKKVPAFPSLLTTMSWAVWEAGAHPSPYTPPWAQQIGTTATTFQGSNLHQPRALQPHSQPSLPVKKIGSNLEAPATSVKSITVHVPDGMDAWKMLPMNGRRWSQGSLRKVKLGEPGHKAGPPDVSCTGIQAAGRNAPTVWWGSSGVYFVFRFHSLSPSFPQCSHSMQHVAFKQSEKRDRNYQPARNNDSNSSSVEDDGRWIKTVMYLFTSFLRTSTVAFLHSVPWQGRAEIPSPVHSDQPPLSHLVKLYDARVYKHNIKYLRLIFAASKNK